MDHHELFLSCRFGDLSKLTYLVEHKEVDLNVRDKWDSTPLYYACLCGHTELVNYLLENGAKCEANTFDGERCLYAALTQEIKKLLKSYNMVSSRTMRRDLYDEFLRRLLEGDAHSDILFIVHGHSFPVHRCVLSARSEYFSDMIKTKWRLKREIHLTNPEILLSAFQSILQYIYTGHLEIDVKNLDACHRLVKQCRLYNLTTQIEDELKKIVSFQKSKLGVDVTMVSTQSDLVTLQSHLSALYDHSLPPELSNWPTNSESFYPDVCFAIEGHRFMCHKAFFCGRSDYFKVLLLDHFGEIQSDDTIPVLPLKDVKLDVFVAILYYIYTDKCQIEKKNVYEVLSTADVYLLPGLKRLCAGVIGEFIDSENVVAILQTARVYNLPRLQDECAQFMADSIEEMVERDDFEMLVKEDAATVENREEADSIDIIDEIRFHITNFIQTFSAVEEANEKLMVIEHFLETLGLEG